MAGVSSDGDAWNQDDEHRLADALHMLERMHQDHEDRVLADAAESLGAADTSDVPAPDTAHPALEQYAAAVRTARVDPVLVSVPRPLTAVYMDADQITPTISARPEALVLTRKKCAGPVPWTGEGSAFYVWPVWVDNFGRHIAGPTEIVVRSR